MPYFLKLREYNDFESRDLWEFVLKLNDKDKELFVAHLWDMNYALFDYYYFSENCSYHILRFVDAIKPEWNLVEDLHSFVIPIDTLVPLIQKKDVVKNFFSRPSLYKRALAKYENMNEKEKEFINSSLKTYHVNKIDFKTDKEKAKALDMLIDFVDYKYSSDIYLPSQNDEIRDFKTEILMARSQVGK